VVASRTAVDVKNDKPSKSNIDTKHLPTDAPVEIDISSAVPKAKAAVTVPPVAGAAAAGKAVTEVLYAPAVGQHHADTVRFNDFVDDEKLQSLIVQSGYRIGKITTFGNRFANGWAVSYRSRDGKSWYDAKPHRSSNDQPIARTHEFDADEWLTRINCRVGQLLDSIHFITNKGRTVEAGSSTGGKPISVPTPLPADATDFVITEAKPNSSLFKNYRVLNGAGGLDFDVCLDPANGCAYDEPYQHPKTVEIVAVPGGTGGHAHRIAAVYIIRS